MNSNPASPQNPPSPLTAQGTFGLASSCHWLGAHTASAVLESGGTAFDAVVAAGFVLQVVEPHFNGPAGEVVALLAPADGPPHVLAGAGPAPRSATTDLFLGHGFDLIPGGGVLSAAVPGQFDAWCLLLRDHGTWTLSDVLAFAIDQAESGFPVTASLRRALAASLHRFVQHWPTSAAQWCPDGQLPNEGALLTNTAWAHTLRKLATIASEHKDRQSGIDAARAAWSTGFVAEAITTFISQPSWHPGNVEAVGLITSSDLADYRAVFEEPISLDFMGVSVVKAGAWTQGPVFLQTLGILAAKRLNQPDRFDLEDPHTIHDLIESTNLAMADREAYFGDISVPLDTLLSDAYLRDRAAIVTEDSAYRYPPGIIGGHVPHLPVSEIVSHPLTQDPWAPERLGRSDTCQICVVDSWGNMVSATPSGGWLQSSPFIPNLGFALGTRLQQLWLDSRSASALRPGSRPRLTLTPTLIYSGDTAILAMGSPGGDGQNQWQHQLLLRILEPEGLIRFTDMQKAINAPAFQSLGFASSFWPREFTPHGVLIENRLSQAIQDDLTARGHHLHVVDGWSLGRVSVVGRDPATGELFAAVSTRGGQGAVAGK